MQKTDFFFDDFFPAIIYLGFVVAAPIVSIILQFSINDKTLYLSYLIAGFSLTYDYIFLLKKTINRRLWIEAILAIICILTIIPIAIGKLIPIMQKVGSSITYTGTDFCFMLILGIMVIINIFEFGHFAKNDYKKRNFGKGENKTHGIVDGGKSI